MKFEIIENKELEDKEERYFISEKSFECYPSVNADINVVMAYLNLGIDSEDMCVKCFWGFSPKESWKDANLFVPVAVKGELRLVEDIIAGLKMFQDGDVDSKEYQEALIDTFLVAAYVYDDSIRIVFNLGGKKQKEISLPFDIDTISDNVSAGDVSFNSPAVHQNFT